MQADSVGAPVTTQQWDYVHDMGAALRASLDNVTAVFAPSCIGHSVLTKRDWLDIKIDDISLAEALRCWEKSTASDKQLKKRRTAGQNGEKLTKEERALKRQEKLERQEAEKRRRRKMARKQRQRELCREQRRKLRQQLREQQRLLANGTQFPSTPTTPSRTGRSSNPNRRFNNKNLSPKVIEYDQQVQQQQQQHQVRKSRRRNNCTEHTNHLRHDKTNHRGGGDKKRGNNSHNNRHKHHQPTNGRRGFLAAAVPEISEPKKCSLRLLERCSWPQCNNSCPRLTNPLTGEEMKFLELLASFGLDMEAVATALGVDMHTLNNMDQAELVNLLTQQAS